MFLASAKDYCLNTHYVLVWAKIRSVFDVIWHEENLILTNFIQMNLFILKRQLSYQRWFFFLNVFLFIDFRNFDERRKGNIKHFWHIRFHLLKEKWKMQHPHQKKKRRYLRRLRLKSCGWSNVSKLKILRKKNIKTHTHNSWEKRMKKSLPFDNNKRKTKK